MCVYFPDIDCFNQNGKKCTFCEQTFKYYYELNEHLKSHQRSFYKLSLQSNTNKKWLRLMNGEKKYKCRKCRHLFKYYSLFKHHIRKCLGGNHSCVQCKKTFKTQSLLFKHQKRHSYVDVNVFKCEICCRRFKNPSVLMSHANEQHGFNIFRDDIKFELSEVGENAFAYDFASQETQNINNILSTVDIERELDKLSEVMQVDKNILTLALHGEREKLKQSHGLAAFICKFCVIPFLHVTSLAFHLRKQHNIDVFDHQIMKYFPKHNRFFCVEQNCSAAFNKISVMAQHMLIYHPEVKYVCDLCDYSTVINSHLLR